MSNALRSGIAATRIDRRTMLHHSSGGLAIPALGAAGMPGAGGAAHSVLDYLPKSQLAILPGTTHTGVIHQTDLLLGMIVPFLDAPMPEAQ